MLNVKDFTWDRKSNHWIGMYKHLRVQLVPVHDIVAGKVIVYYKGYTYCVHQEDCHLSGKKETMSAKDVITYFIGIAEKYINIDKLGVSIFDSRPPAMKSLDKAFGLKD